MRYRLFLFVGIVLALVLGAGYVAAQLAANYFAEEKIRSVLRRVSDRADVQFDGAKVNLLQQSLILKDVAVELKGGQHGTVGSIEVKEIDRKHLRSPHFLTLVMEDLTIPVNEANFKDKLPMVQELGLPSLVVDMVVDYRYEPQGKRLTVEEFSLDVAGGIVFQLSCTVNNFSFDAIRKQQFSELELASLQLQYEDETILRGLMQQAGEEEKDLLLLVEDWIREELFFARQANDTETTALLTPLLEYVQAPGTFAMDMTLNQPLTLPQVEPIKKISELRRLFTFNIR